MSSFKAVNTTLAAPDPVPGRSGEETTPTTPRPNSTFFHDSQRSEDARTEDPSAKTPTRNSFALSNQRLLPSTPGAFTLSQDATNPPSQNGVNGTLGRMDSHSSHRSTHSLDSQDIDMGHHEDDDRDGSDNESTSDGNRPSKKKKAQKFYCQNYPPCNLSFTRSEHLARHIRKHTGERPFKCHCGRRFSRLDNLRQHAQTVHVNEDIPAESLAATGTRFQRQIRTDRVRPAAGRNRASTLGSQGGHSRTHSRNLSTSSTISNASNISVSHVQDARRRPQPLAMAGNRLSLNIDPYNPPLMGSPGPVEYVEYHPQSTEATTPTSATFSTANGSPSFHASAFQSPVATGSRPVSWGGPAPGPGTPGRRMSVPSGVDAYGPPHGHLPPPSYHAPLPSSTSSTFGSPIAPQFPETRREPELDSEWRRRTWHPGYTGARPATSGLGYHQTPDAPRPSFTSQPAASQTRLPGIESFDHVPPPPHLSRRPGSPMQMDPPAGRPASHYGTPETYMARGEKRKSISWDADTVQQRIHRLAIESPNPARDQWSQYHRHSYSGNRPVTAPHSSYMSPQQPTQAPPRTQAPPAEYTGPAHESLDTPQRNRRHGWYNGPISEQSLPPPPRARQRRSPEGSSSSEGVPTPSGQLLTEPNPAVLHSNGHIETRTPAALSEEQRTGPSTTSIMNRPHPLHQHSSSFHDHRHMPQSSPYPRQETTGLSFTFSRSRANTGARDTTALDTLAAVATVATADGVR